MNTRTIAIALAAFFMMACVCPLCGAFAIVTLDSLDNRTLAQGLQFLFLALLCAVPLLLAVAGLIWQVVYALRAPQSARRLAEPLGLQPLNQAGRQLDIWYGGNYHGRSIATRPLGNAYRYYALDRSRTGVRFALRIVMALQPAVPLGVVVHHGSGRAASRDPMRFEDVFEADNDGRLSPAVQAAMLDFVQKGYPTGITGVTLRISKGTRNLRLCDRATAPAELIRPEILPAAAMILVHDHPDVTISADSLRALLDDLAVVAGAIEQSH